MSALLTIPVALLFVSQTRLAVADSTNVFDYMDDTDCNVVIDEPTELVRARVCPFLVRLLTDLSGPTCIDCQL